MQSTVVSALSLERAIRSHLDAEEDLRVLSFNGHQIMANFSLQELGEPIKFEG